MSRASPPDRSRSSEYRGVLDALPVAIVVTDAHERVTIVNEAAAAMLGKRRDACLGQPLSRLVTLPHPLRELAGAGATATWSAAVTLPHAEDPDVAATLSAGSMRTNSATAGYACLLHPAEGAASGGAAGLEHLERLIAMGQMVAGFAHEVRNPLAALKSLVEDLVADTPPGDPHEENLARIERLLRRIEGLVRSSLQFSKPNAPLRQACAPAALVSAALDVLEPRVREMGGAALCPEIAAELPELFIDDDQLVQVLVVFLNNALDATRDATRVAVRVRAAASAGTGAAVLFEVEDSGPGIAPEVLPHIFDPFFTTKARGTGLGLAIARRLVRENGGQIHVRSGAGEGALFTVELPAYVP